MKMLNKKCLVVILLALSYPLCSQDIRLGAVADFKRSPVLDSIFQVIALEIDRTTGAARKVTLAPENVVYANTSLSQARTNYDLLIPKVDLVLLVGGVSIKGTLTGGEFTKPTIGLGVIDPDLQEIPFENGKSGVKNFTYIWASQDFAKELTEFHRLYPINNLSVLVDAASAVTFNQQKAQQVIDSMRQLLSISLEVVPITQDIPISLSAIPDGTDAVYLTDLYGKTSKEIREISDVFKARKLPSFSSSKWHVDNGILACISDENDLNQTIRKLAIMIDDALGGAPLAEMPVLINHKQEFFLNMQTARDIDFSPPFDILFTANLIREENEQLPTYSIQEIMERSLEANLDIKISYKDIELAEQDIRSARSGVLPALDLSFSGTQINAERANAAFAQPERQLSGDLAFSQLLFSEEAIASIKIAQYLKKAQEYDTELDVLNVLLDTYLEYFQVLSAKTDLLIQEENLSNSKTNLELAKIRVSVGSASNADIYRWESEVASAMQTVVQAQTTLLTTKLRLNTFLANTLPPEFDIADVTIDGGVYEDFSRGPWAELVKTPADLKEIMEFMVLEALQGNPNKKVLLENLRATERRRLQNQRLLYTPTVAFQASTTQVLDRGGEGSTEVPGGLEFFDNSWQLGLSLRYPIFQGNVRRVNLQRATVQLEQLNYSRQRLDQDLELAVRSSILQVLNTTTNIDFSKVASDNAQLNFELVQNNYRQGTVTITQLIDAQRAALQARLSYALSIYNYMQAQLQFEFAVGSFSMFATPEEISGLQNRFLQFRNDN